MELEHLNESNFDSTITSSKGLVVVDFFATWCGPCRMLSPILESVQEEMGDKVKIYKADIDECMEIAKKFGIMSVPTMVVFKDGKEVNKIMGLRQKGQIVSALESL